MGDGAVLTIEGAARLVRSGVFVPGDLVGATEYGHALYAGPQGTLIARPSGPRPAGVHAVPAASWAVAQ